MAQLPYTAAPEKDPSEGIPDDYQHIHADAASFGGQLAQGEEALGKGLEQTSGNFFEAAKYYDQLAADDQFNKADVLARNLRRGDPSKQVPGPDGKPVPDTGYMGLQGKDALDQREGVEKQLDTILEQARGNLKSSYAQKQFDEHSRIARQKWAEEIAAHADNALKIWGGAVNEDRAKISQDGISAHPDDPQKLAQHTEALIEARVRQGQLKYGNDPGMLEMIKREASKESMKYRVEAVGVTDPARAMSILDANRDLAGTLYEQLAGRFKGPALKANGQVWGDVFLGRRSDLSYADQRFQLPEGTIGGMMQVESGMNPLAASKVSPSHTGLVGANPEWNARWGVTDPTDVTQNATALGREATANRPQLTRLLGRDPTASEYWLAHNQGLGGAIRQLENPNELAWKNMANTAEGRAKGDAWARDAIWNQLTKAQKGFFKSVDNIKGSDLVSNLQVTFERAGKQVPFVDKETAYKRLDAGLVHNTPLYHATKSYIDQEIGYQQAANATRISELKRDIPNYIKANWDGVHMDLPPDSGILGTELEKFQEQLAFARAVGDKKREIQYNTPEQDTQALLSISSGMGMSGEQMRVHHRAATSGPGAQALPAGAPDWLRQQAGLNDQVHQAVLTGGDEGETPESAAALYEPRKRALTEMQEAIKHKYEALVGKDADPAAYLIRHRDIQPLLGPLDAALKSGNPAQIAPAYEAYANKQVDLQTYLGVPREQQHVMTKGAAMELVSRIEKSNDPQAEFERAEKTHGGAWPHVLRDMVTIGGMPPRRQATTLLPDNRQGADYASMLGKWEREKPKDKVVADVLPGGHKVVQAIKDNIDADPAVQSLLFSMQQSGSSVDQVEGVKASIRELAHAMVYAGYAPGERSWLTSGRAATVGNFNSDAAQKAADAFTAHFDFEAVPGAARILRTDAPGIKYATKAALEDPAFYDQVNSPVITTLYRRKAAQGYGAHLLERAGELAYGAAHGQFNNPVLHELGTGVITKDQEEAETKAREQIHENYNEADKQLQMSSQEKAYYERHLKNLWSNGGVTNADGSRSSLKSTTVEMDGRTYTLPTVWDGKILAPEAAIQRAEAEGFDKFPSYGSREEADLRYGQMHDFMEKDTAAYLATRSDQRHGIPEHREYVDMVKANPYWINSPSGDSLWLMDWQHRIVRDRAGAPIEVKIRGNYYPLPPTGSERARWRANETALAERLPAGS